MSDSLSQTLSVPNKLQLDLYTGVLALAFSKHLYVITVLCSFRPAQHGECSAVFRFYVSCKIASSQIGILFGYVQCKL